jgi:hypothetical protein
VRPPDTLGVEDLTPAPDQEDNVRVISFLKTSSLAIGDVGIDEWGAFEAP